MTVRELRDLLNGYPDDVTIFITDRRSDKKTSPFGDIESIDYDYVNEMLYFEAIT